MPRRKPYTAIGVRRLKCFRCGEPARTTWSVCADGNLCRPLCLPCDIALNEMVLRWMGDPAAGPKLTAYRRKMKARYE